MISLYYNEKWYIIIKIKQFKLMNSMNYDKNVKNGKEITIKSSAKNKLNANVFKVGLKVRL